MTLTYDDYLAHYGVKGMKWGKRKARGSDSDKSSSDRTPEEQAARKARRKKVAVGVASVVGVAAVVGVTAMSANKIQNGKKTASVISKKAKTINIEDAVRKMQEGEKKKAQSSQDQMFKDIQARIDAGAKAKAATDRILKENQDVPANILGHTKRQKERTAEARDRINSVASKGFFDMAASTLSQSDYGERPKARDTKRYGEDGASRIGRKVDNGADLSTARRQEQRRRGRRQMAKGAVNYARGRN